MLLILVAVVWATIAHICARIAVRKNRNPTAWFIFVFLFGVLALIALYFLPPKEKAIPAPIPPSPALQKLWYYLGKENKQYGPMSFAALKEAYFHKKLVPSTFLWQEEMDNWKSLEKIPEVFDLIQK